MRCNESTGKASKSVSSSSILSRPSAIKACLRWDLKPWLILVSTACIMLWLSATLVPTDLYKKIALAQVKKKPKLFLHIGAHKTGSSYIKYQMMRSRDFLLQRGIMLPMGCYGDTNSPSSLFRAVAMQLQGMKIPEAKNCPENPLGDLTRTLESIHRDNDSQNIFISSEHFDNLNDEMVAEVTKLFSNFQTTVVLYYRRKQEHLVSYYSEFAKRADPLKSPLHLSDFLWNVMAEVDPEADVSGPLPSVPTANGRNHIHGVCYKRVLETYGRHFGPENMVVVHYNGVMDAQKDPWEVLVREVMMLEMGKEATAEKGAKRSLQQGKGGTKINASLNPLTYSTAVLFYRWRWGNLRGQVNSTTSAAASPSPAEEPSQIDNTTRLPDTGCVSRFLKPLEDLLPKQCFDLRALASLWEAQERQSLNEMARKGSRLLYFDWAKDAAGDMRVVFNDANPSLPCQVHLEQLFEEHGENVLKTIPARFLPAFEQVAAKVDDKC
ncbi:hypothetical protein Naga_100316g6 [Nannochloropsis gaditana]|uniref:Uncharacterized protein n=1 Tax=Nannochloropsis gaditana TaxID=72520 RepID=W7T7Y3_9STRA|nr:hypothetical protein Naga_100316g6 [Nannochloropsis gaditana]